VADVVAQSGPDAHETLDAVVVGAGFAGLYMLHRLRGLGLSACVFEAGGGVGGTWFWNRYPGARCDVESIDYQYSFDKDLLRDWVWTERYPRQEELLRYLNHVADRFDLRHDIRLNARVCAATFDETAGRWEVRTDRGDRVSARFAIIATGCLSATKSPDFPGLESFEGDWFHTGAWPRSDIDFAGKRVAVVGTGSSAIQLIPVVAERAAELIVFQRTANFSIPAHNRPYLAAEHDLERYDVRRKVVRESFGAMFYPGNEKSALEVSPRERERELEERWQFGGLAVYGAFADLLVNAEANATAAAFFAAKIREKVDDPVLATLLTPAGFPIGAKRICVDTDYYETFNLDHVRVVDVGTSPIREITPAGIRTDDAVYAADAIVFAIGYDAMTGALAKIDIRGHGGHALTEEWSAGPRTYLGIGVAGFPNMFIITGPGSPSVLSNMVVSIEQHVDWIADALVAMRAAGDRLIEATEEAQDAWVAHVNAVASETLLPAASSWYMGANIPGKPRLFMPYAGGVGAYREKCDEVAANGYAGFRLTG
jgi:cyclohexanone monooxygenase